MDPIKPKQSLAMKPDFKKGGLRNCRIFYINVEDYTDLDADSFVRRLQSSFITEIPQQYINNQESEIVSLDQISLPGGTSSY